MRRSLFDIVEILCLRVQEPSRLLPSLERQIADLVGSPCTSGGREDFGPLA